ncbi:MAG TPA: FAD-dependent oxidoreductase [Rhodanobacteraceae bacterium]
MSRHVILGAGVMGLVMASELVARGEQVQLRDPHLDPGPHACSWWAGGMLAPWCERESAEEPVLRLGRESLDWWHRHTGLVMRRGTLVVAPARDRAELARFARRSEGHRVLDAAQLAELEPALAGRFEQALFYPDEGNVAPREVLPELRRRLQKAGAQFTLSDEVPADGPFIDCRGLAARDVLGDLRGVRGEMLYLRCPDITLTRPLRLLHPRMPLYIVPRGQGVYMLGGSVIESEATGPVTVRSLLELLNAAWTVHPAFGEAAVIETGAGARPAFVDNLPHLRRQGRRLLLNGLYRHGFLLSPALARMAADHLLSGTQPELMQEAATC